MTDLVSEIDNYTAAKATGQKQYMVLVKSMSDEQMLALAAAATPEALAAIKPIRAKVEAQMEGHPLAEHVVKALNPIIGRRISVHKGKAWGLLDGDDKRYRAYLDVLAGPQLVLVFGELLSDSERNTLLAPWRAVMGSAAGI